MRQTARRQILEDLGLVPWRLRRVDAGAREAGEALAMPETRSPEHPQGPAVPPAATRITAPPPERSALPATPPTPAVAPWAALSLALPGVVMLVDGGVSRRDRRLAMDVLAAAAGDWHSRPVSRRLEWPPPVATAAVAMDDEAARRALAAFAGKDVTDHAARLLLCVASLARRLPAAEPECRRLVIADLEELGREPAAKRDLWRELRGART